MPRNKYPEITVEKIFHVAKELFLKQGYHETSLDQIAKNSGVTKGAIYHHFSSKEDLLDKLISSYMDNESWILEIKNNTSLNGLEKLRAIFQHELGNSQKLELDIIVQSSLQDPKIIAKEIEESLKNVAPLLEEIIKEGNQDGSMHVCQPKQISEMLIILINIWINPGICPTSKEEFIDKTKCLNEFLTKMGIPLFDHNILSMTENYYERTQK